MAILFLYHESENPEGAFIDGAPLTDIDTAIWEALPGHVQASVRACPFYAPTGWLQEERPSLQLPGIGKEITTALENAGFKTAADIAAASDEDLLAVSGIGHGRLQTIREALEAASQEEGD